MDIDSALSLLVQIPIVGIFVWYVLKSSKDWREWLRDRDKQQDAVIARLTRELERLTEHVDMLTRVMLYHDATVRGPNADVKGDTKEMIEKLLVSMKGD